MRIFDTPHMIQVALGSAYPGDTSMAELLDYLTRIQHTQNTGLAKMVMDVQLAKIRTAVNDQHDPIPQWLHYCYGPDLEIVDKISQKRLLSRFLALRIHAPTNAIKVRTGMEKMASCALEDYRLGLLRGQRLPVMVYCELLGSREKDFNRNWGRYRQRAMDILHGIHTKGIAHVSGVVQALREAGN